VYLAEHRQTKQQYAVKAIQKKKVKDYTTFINEINILKQLVRLQSLTSAGPSEYHQAVRNVGMARSVLSCP
jgi:serine/threonine protein kinase